MPEASSAASLPYGAILTVVAMTSVQVVVTMAFTTKMSSITHLLEPCNDECVHAKLFPDAVFQSTYFNSSALPWDVGAQWHMTFNRGAGKTFMNYTQCHKLVFVTNGKKLETMSKCPDNSFVHAMPNPTCPDMSLEDMQDLCDTRKALQKIVNLVYGSMSMKLFLASTALWGLSRVIHDVMILWTQGVEEQAIFTVLMLNIFFLSMMACSSIVWSTGALGLFVAPIKQECACYYKVRDAPAFLFLAVPLSLTKTAVDKLRDMWLAFRGGSFLLSITYHVPYIMVVSASADPTGSLLSMEGAGVASETLDRKRWEPLLSGKSFTYLCIALLGGSVELSFSAIALRLTQFTSLDLHQGPVAVTVIVFGMLGGVLAFMMYVVITMKPVRPIMFAREIAAYSELRARLESNA